MKERIQGWTSQPTGIQISFLSKVRVDSMPCRGCPMLNSWLTVGRGWMLCRVSSELRILRGWPARTVMMCGEYMHPFWSSSTASVGGG